MILFAPLNKIIMSMDIEHCNYLILLYSLSKNLTTARVLGVHIYNIFCSLQYQFVIFVIDYS